MVLWKPVGRKSDKVAELGRLEPFWRCRPRDLRLLASIADEITFAEGELICREGLHAYEWFVIVSGRAEVRLRDQPVAVLGCGEVVGETAILAGEVRTATVSALTEVTAFVIDRRRVDDLLERAPAIGRGILEQLSRRLRAADSTLVAVREELVAA